jgi:hypothetical protein
MIDIGVAILELLRQALAQVGPSPWSPQRPVDEYLPTKATLAALLPNAAARETKISAYLAEVQGRYNQAVVNGLVTSLGSARALNQVMKNGGPGVSKSLDGLPQNTVDTFYEKLVLDNESAAGGTVLGRDLLMDVTTPADHKSSSDKTINAIMSLRHVDDLLTRILGAQHAATSLGVPMREVMAMYRTEGDLNAPPSAPGLASGIPPGVTDAVTSLNPAPDISRLVVVCRNFNPAASDAEWQLLGMQVWFVQIAGLDVVGSLQEEVAAGRATNFRDAFQQFSSGNRSEAGLPAPTRANAGTRFDAALANMVVTKKTSHGKEAVIIAPQDPIALLSAVLQEAIALQRKLALFKKDLVTDPEANFNVTLGPTLSYLRFHQTKYFKAILVRAMIAANDLAGIRYLELRRELTDDVQLQSALVALKPVKKMIDSAASVPVLNGQWPRLVEWFNAPTLHSATKRFDLLADFVRTADASAAWNSWKEGRGNMSRYAVLLDYYTRLFP